MLDPFHNIVYGWVLCTSPDMSRRLHISDIYASQMDELHYGHALWCPDGYDDSGEIKIGDVGFVKEGIFSRMFNVKYPCEHPLNQGPRDCAPLDHQPFESDLGEVPHSTNINAVLLASRSVKCTNVEAIGSGWVLSI